MALYKIHRFVLLSPPLYMFCFVLLWFFCSFVLLLIAMSCHCSVCVRLSLLIKDYLEGLVVCTLWIGIHEVAHFSDNAKVRNNDSWWRRIKCEIFRITLSHFIHVHFRTFAFYNFPTSHVIILITVMLLPIMFDCWEWKAGVSTPGCWDWIHYI